MNAEQLRTYVNLEQQRLDFEAQIDAIKKETAELEAALLPQFEQDAIDRISIDGRTVYVERKLWAKAKDGDKPAVCKALKRSRLGDYVEEIYNTNSLSAYIRELDREGKQLSPSLATVLDISEVFKLRTRRS